MSARVSGHQSGVITLGGHKILPYDVVVIDWVDEGRRLLFRTLFNPLQLRDRPRF